METIDFAFVFVREQDLGSNINVQEPSCRTTNLTPSSESINYRLGERHSVDE